MPDNFKNNNSKTSALFGNNSQIKKANRKNKLLNAVLFKGETYHGFQVALIILLVIVLVSLNLYYFISFLVNGLKM